MKTKEIQARLDRGYTMAIYGTRENIHEQMTNDIKELLEAINYTRCYCTFDSLLKRLQGLNELKRPDFKWTEQFKKDNRIAWEDKEVELRALINKLEKELNVL